MHGSVLAAVQLALQTLDLLLICGSEDVNGTTDVTGMTHPLFSGNPRACDNRFRSDQPCHLSQSRPQITQINTDWPSIGVL